MDEVYTSQSLFFPLQLCMWQSLLWQSPVTNNDLTRAKGSLFLWHSIWTVSTLHTIFRLLKIPILSHESLFRRVQPKQKNWSFVIVWAIYATKTKTAWKMSHTRAKILHPRYGSPVACGREKVIRHMTSDVDVCEIDLDTQMSFLNAAPLAALLFVLKLKTLWTERFCWKKLHEPTR